MNLPQPVHHWQEHPLQLRLGQRAVASQQGVERFAVLVVHHDVGGVVGLEAVAHPHHVRMLEAGQRPGLVQKPAQAPLEPLAVACRLRVDLRAVAHGDLIRQVLLHGDLDAQPRVLAQVGHAEPANAQDAHHMVGAKLEASRQRLFVIFAAHGRAK